MPEKSSAGKTAGKIFLVIAVVIAAAALLLSSYLGGQQKTVNSYYTAIIRDEYSSFDKLFADGVLSDEGIKMLSEEYSDFSENFGLDEDSTMHVRINFKHRRQTSAVSADYYFTVTYYDDDANDETTDTMYFSMVRNGMKWQLTSIEPTV